MVKPSAETRGIQKTTDQILTITDLEKCFFWLRNLYLTDAQAWLGGRGRAFASGAFLRLFLQLSKANTKTNRKIREKTEKKLV